MNRKIKCRSSLKINVFLYLGERVSLAITLLLAMTVFMLVVADIIPATSDVVPLVGIYFR